MMKHRRLFQSLVAVLASTLPSACSSSDGGAPVQDAGMEGGFDDAPRDAPVEAPSGCDASADPKGAPKCVDNDFAVFVNGATGLDSNPGTKEQPLKTIGASLSKGKPRVYVCEGTYAEHVKVTSGIALVGGFSCSTWTYSGTTARVAPTDEGYALEVNKVSSAVEVTDVVFTAAVGSVVSPSSIAAFVAESAQVRFRRVELTAGAGAEGNSPSKAADGALMSSTPTAGTLNGNIGGPTNGGLAQLCTCVAGATSKGGGGGNLNSDGSPGETAILPPDPLSATGLGSTVAECAGGQGGRTGSNAPASAAATGAKRLGELTADGWKPEAGKTGVAGAAGQGGGGGGGAGGGGGGGACGGCGGSAGAGGGGGGASVALLTVDSPVTLIASTLTTGSAGQGGAGAPGGDGISGGIKGNQGGGACPGGNGGKGGAGSTGGGGAGGVSVGVLFKGPKPNVEAKITTGEKGAPGNDAVDGAKAETLEVQ